MGFNWIMTVVPVVTVVTEVTVLTVVKVVRVGTLVKVVTVVTYKFTKLFIFSYGTPLLTARLFIFFPFFRRRRWGAHLM